MTLEDMDRDINALIAKLHADERIQKSSHFSSTRYNDEPIIFTGRQMSSYMPDRYREMRAISRWQEGADGKRGRWLSEDEFFYLQATLMADFEDDCPYQGTFKAYSPTYNAMSDRQLRGYFTWRTQVRAGNVEETSLSFAFVYLYELLCGIGCADAQDGFHTIKSFWETYRAFAPELDRYVRVWLADYVVYHNLPASLLEDSRTLEFDHALIALKRAQAIAEQQAPRQKTSARGGAPILMPPNPEVEEPLFRAIDTLSTYRIASSKFAKDHYDDLRHVACAVYLRLAEHYAKHRKLPLIESLFGENISLPYTMFASAVFFDPQKHPDCNYELDEAHRYRCQKGYWSCEKYRGGRARNPKLGSVMRAVDCAMREAWDYAHPLKESDVPKYIAKMVEREVSERHAWALAHRPVEVNIDLSRLRQIRSAAAEVREALLIDEERGEGTGANEAASETAADSASPAEAPPVEVLSAKGASGESTATAAATDNANKAIRNGDDSPTSNASQQANVPETPQDVAARAARAASPCAAIAETPPSADVAQGAASSALAAAPGPTAAPGPVVPASATVPGANASSPLDADQAQYLAALLASDAKARAQALSLVSISEDMMVDAINEALFDLLGDTAIEYGPDGPQIIEDYREDVEEILA